jgi:glycine/D-amino acid oxidase-like deaminating enzyme
MAKAVAYDAVVVGSGPNGLAAAIVIAQAGKSVAVFEANDSAGGGVRSAELTLPGYVHDLCSSVYPLAIGSPFFAALPLGEHGLEWIQSGAALAHPLDDGTAILLERSVEATANALGADELAYRKIFTPLTAQWNWAGTFWVRRVGRASHSILRALDCRRCNRRGGLPSDVFARAEPGRSLPEWQLIQCCRSKAGDRPLSDWS